MKLYELSLDADAYNDDWDTWCGIRELIQNAVDADKDGSKMTIEHVDRVRNRQRIPTLVISNFGITIPKEAFLIGHTTKSSGDYIGRYGEGFKFGILTLLRKGFQVKIRNGEESWNPKIVRSTEYKANILAFEVSNGNKPEPRVQIEILGLDLQEWLAYKERFLFLKEESYNKIQTYSGEILLDPAEKGKIYCKGIYVRTDNSYSYGYNFHQATLDRNRKIVEDLGELTARILSEASGKLTKELYHLLKNEAPEIYSLYSLPQDAAKEITRSFQNEFGEKSLPVETADQTIKLAHFGIKGVKLPYNLRSILISTLGRPSDHLTKLKTAVNHQYDMSELSEIERLNFYKSDELLREICSSCGLDKTVLDRTLIVEFCDPQLKGIYSDIDRSISIARDQLSSKAKTLRTMIHEIAHTMGEDGEKSHEQAIGDLTEAIFNITLP